MKKLLLRLLCVGGFCVQGFSQAPTDYYFSAHGKTGEDLKTSLYHIIKDHTEFSYTSSSTDTWDILKEADKDPENEDNVILIYSGRSVDAAQEYNSGNGWTREHVWAKSRGDFGTSKGAGTDTHHLRPLDGSVNSTRSNRAFDNCDDCSMVIDGSFETGSYTDTNQWTFEPRDEVKGDVARMIFYMATRYEGDNNEPDLELTQTIFSQYNKEPFHGTLEALLEWHREDPVSDFEMNRNNVIYSYQDNRNPFIDFPELVEHIWGNKIGENWINPLSEEEFDFENVKFYPNPTTGAIFINNVEKESSVEVYDLAGRKMISKNLTIGDNKVELPKEKGIYFITLKTQNSQITKKIVKL
ncbi:endonuclease [Aureivirga sp. CE67]|uniref:endonuclease n=1 Tax=Aureivirga sp. CE67 TaxID=1788983 RepID=UPI0018C9C85A|nr:endonuclease [Aureivirga sp. CE67]